MIYSDTNYEIMLERSGYLAIERDGKHILFDLVGEFIDSDHSTKKDLIEYAVNKIFTTNDYECY